MKQFYKIQLYPTTIALGSRTNFKFSFKIKFLNFQNK